MTPPSLERILRGRHIFRPLGRESDGCLAIQKDFGIIASVSETPPSNTERVPADFLPLYPAPLQLAIGAVALYVIVAVAIHLPSLEGIATQLIGGEGALRALQMLDSHTRGIGAHAWFTTHYGYPWGDAFTWGDNVLIPSLIATALRTLDISLGAIFNLLLITASLLNGYCAFRLVYQLTGSGYVSVVGGLSFLLGPPYLLLDYDPTLQASFILPVVISAALRFVGMPTLRHGALLGLLLSAALLISLDLAVVGGIAALLILAGIALIHPLPNILRLYRSAFGGLALGLLASVPILWAYRGARQVLAPLALTELGNRSATVSSFVPAINFECLFDAKGLFLLFPGISGTVIACGAVLALLRLTDTRHLRIILALWGIALLGVALEPPPQHVLAPLFAGIVIVSALALLHRLGRLEHQLNVRIVTNRDLIAVFVLLGSFFFLYSLASPSAAVSPNGIFSSIAFILGVLPFSQPIAGVIAVGLTVTVLASFTLVRLLRRSSRRLFIALLLGTLLTVERFPFCGIPHEPLPLARNTERALKLAAPAGAIAIALPLSEVPHIPSGSPNPALSSLQLPLITLINPTTPRTPEFFKELAHETADFPSARAIRSLSRIAGLRYILVHEASPIGRLGGSLMERAERFGDDIRYIESDGDGRYLFELIAATRITGDTVILAPAHSRGVLQLELKALYEPEEPHIPLTIRWRTKETSAVLSEATVTANGEWGEFSFPLPVRRSSPEPLEITFETPPQARVWFRRAGFTPF